MSTFKKEKQISRLRSSACSHSFVDKKGSAAGNLLGFLREFILRHLFGYILFPFFCLFIYKTAHVDMEINNLSVESVGMETNNPCSGPMSGWLIRIRKQKPDSGFEIHWQGGGGGGVVVVVVGGVGVTSNIFLYMTGLQ